MCALKSLMSQVMMMMMLNTSVKVFLGTKTCGALSPPPTQPPWFKFSFPLFQTHYHVIIIHYHT